MFFQLLEDLKGFANGLYHVITYQGAAAGATKAAPWSAPRYENDLHEVRQTSTASIPLWLRDFFFGGSLKKGMGLGGTNGSGVHLKQKKSLKYIYIYVPKVMMWQINTNHS